MLQYNRNDSKSTAFMLSLSFPGMSLNRACTEFFLLQRDPRASLPSEAARVSLLVLRRNTLGIRGGEYVWETRCCASTAPMLCRHKVFHTQSRSLAVPQSRSSAIPQPRSTVPVPLFPRLFIRHALFSLIFPKIKFFSSADYDRKPPVPSATIRSQKKSSL